MISTTRASTLKTVSTSFLSPCKRYSSQSEISFSATEFAVDTFLQAALHTNITFPISSPELWTAASSQGVLFLVASAHALRILKTWRFSNSAAFVGTRRSEIKRLGTRLTELLLSGLLASLSETDISLDALGVAILSFPWHGSLECFVDCLPPEMGALFRFLARVASPKVLLSFPQLDDLAALFPLDHKADEILQAIIVNHRAKRNKSAHQYRPEGTSPQNIPSWSADIDDQNSSDVNIGRESEAAAQSSPRFSELSTGPGIDAHAAVHASEMGQADLSIHVPSPHCSIDMIPTGQGDSVVPDTAAEAPTPVSRSEGAEYEPGPGYLRSEASDIERCSPYLTIDTQPAGRLEPWVDSSGEVDHDERGSITLEQHALKSIDLRAGTSIPHPIADDDSDGGEQS
jgi:hypothetical protein